MIDILKINGSLVPTETPGRYAGWREKHLGVQPIAVSVSESETTYEGNLETRTITVKTEILTEFYPQNI